LRNKIFISQAIYKSNINRFRRFCFKYFANNEV